MSASIPRSGLHALALLSYVERIPRGHQSLRTLSEGSGVPRQTVFRLINDAEQGSRIKGGPPVLEIAAHEFGFWYELHPYWQVSHGNGRIIDVVRTGH